MKSLRSQYPDSNLTIYHYSEYKELIPSNFLYSPSADSGPAYSTC